MSRTATATPPPPYFPQRTSTPTLRHASPSVPSSHFRAAPHHSPEKRAGRRIKHLPPSLSGLKGKKAATSGSGVRAGSTADEEEVMADSPISATPSPPDLTDNSSSSASTSINTPSLDTPFVLPRPDPSSDKHPKVTVIPSSPSPANIPTSPPPARSWVPHFALSKITKAVLPSFPPWTGVSIGSDRKKKPSILVDIPVVWDVASRVVGEGEGVFVPEARARVMPQEELEGLDEDGIKRKKREWAEKEHLKLTECARLCSQWPQSGYNITKWGPNGSKHCYEPQSYANPAHVGDIMSRQSALESTLISTSSLFFPSPHREGSFSTPRYSSSGSDESFDDNSALPSPTTTAASDHETGGLGVAKEIRAAMGSPLLGYEAGASLVSLLLPPALGPPAPAPTSSGGQGLRSVQSLSELNRLAGNMILSKTPLSGSIASLPPPETGAGDKMEIDTDTETVVSLAPSLASLLSTSSNPPSISNPASTPTPSPTPGTVGRTPTRPARAGSCGSKRPLPPPVPSAGEEEKRRKVDDEAMVLDDAVSTGVILPPTSSHSTAALTANTTHTPAGEVFGHIVKTSDTHPIIISPFFPADLLPILSTHLLPPSSGGGAGGGGGMPYLLRSDIDVPALLLAQGSTVVPSPVSSTFSHLASGSSSSLNLTSGNLGVGLGSYLGRSLSGGAGGAGGASAGVGGGWMGGGWANGVGGGKVTLGNLLLSSCPGKRLRMGGPVKGRGPVCRDLKTDLGRIRKEGVGALVCCLDDTELALLGTPWETYRDVANELGLDVIRLPMPDGFTPASLALFDQQVTLIASRYTLKGVNVLVHCRGGVGRAGVTACAWAIKMGFVQPHPSLVLAEENARRAAAAAELASTAPAPAPVKASMIPFFSAQARSHTSSPAPLPQTSPASASTANGTTTGGSVSEAAAVSAELEHQIVMSIVERVVAMIRSRRGLKAIESFEQVQFLKVYVGWLRAGEREREGRRTI